MLLVSCPKKSLPRPISMSFFSTFSSCNFILSTLMFESCIHFKLIGGHGVIYRSNFTVLYMNIYLPFSATFVEETIHSSLGILASLTKHSVQSISCVQLFANPWTAACQASLSITSSQILLKLMSIQSVTPSSHLILCPALLLLPSIFPSIRVFSNESVLRIRWPKYWSVSSSTSPSNEYSGLIFL